jgi:hypothetical protein
MSAAAPTTITPSIVWRVLALAMLAVLMTAMALVIPRHEPWFDEAQAWLLARDAPWWDIVLKYARREGSPSLWHLILAPAAQAGSPPIVLNIISGALALAGAALLLFKSPLPPPLRLLLPAGFFFFYQYGVVARSYALLIPLLWIAALAFPRRFEQPWRFVITLILLSQVSLHGSWISGAMMAIFLGEAAWERRWPLKRWCVLALAFAADTAFIIWQVWPPADLPVPPLTTRYTVWQMLREMGLDSISPWPWFSGIVLLGVLIFFYTRGVLLSYMLTSGGLLAMFAFKFSNVWHQGLLFALLVLHAWLAYGSSIRRRLGAVPDRLWPLTAATLLSCVAIVHVWWSAMAGWHDWLYPYSGSRAAAAYLRAHGIDRQRIHAFKFSTCAVLLYLDHNPFANVKPYMPGSFWMWTREIFVGQTPAAIVQGNPPWILVGALLRPAVEPATPPPLPGYVIERTFPGRIVWKDDFYRTDSFYLYRRVAE